MRAARGCTHLVLCTDMEDVWLKKTKKFVREHWLTVSFVLGFCTDVILLNQIDNIVDNLILLFYAVLASCSLLLFYVGVAQKAPPKSSRFFVKYMPLLMQYSFGGLLSGMLIFYGRSGDLISSAPYLLLIIGVIFGNELIGKRSDKLVFHLALYFIGLFSYIVLVMPVIFGKMGDLIFFLSGIAALIIVTLVVQMLYVIIPVFMKQNTQRVILTIGFIYVGLNTLYFSNIIPPIPLSLTELEIVHSAVKQQSGSYRVVEEVQPIWRNLPFIKPIIHPTEGSIACFARVYAPTRLETDIFHRWEYKDENGNWQERLHLDYPIAGTNEGGYRGYTTVTTSREGEWRCKVETRRGQVLGQRTVIVSFDGQGELVTRYK